MYVYERVILETPYSGDVVRNTRFARACMRDCLKKGEAPFASHLLYTQVLDDRNQKQRLEGMEAGQAWYGAALKTVVYTNLGVSNGMHKGIERATLLGHEIEYRELTNWRG